MKVLWVLLVVILILAIMGAPPVGLWTGHPYGYYPSAVGLIVVVVLLVVLLR